jgi:outer membrane receptor protein involved in Fe transport
VVFNNAEEARNVGAELEFRKSLDFISSSLERWSTGVNMTYVDSRVKLDTTLAFFEEDPELQGQSPFILNGSLRYFNPESRFDFSILLNYFADRIARYGQLGSGRTQFPNWIEAGRFQLDFKLTFGLGSHWMLSFSGQNVLDSSVEFFNENETGRAITALERPGVRLKMAAGYEF